MPAAAPQDPNTATRGLPIPGAAFPVVPTPVPTQVARPDLATVANAPGAVASAIGGGLAGAVGRGQTTLPVSPVASGADAPLDPQALFAAKAASVAPAVASARQVLLGQPAINASDRATQSFAAGNIGAGLGDLGFGTLAAASHAVGAPVEQVGRAVAGTIGDIAGGVNQFAGHLFGQSGGLFGSSAAAATPTQVAGAPLGPGRPVAVPGGTYDPVTGPTLQQALAIGKASDAGAAAAAKAPIPPQALLSRDQLAAQAAAPLPAGFSGTRTLTPLGPVLTPASALGAPGMPGAEQPNSIEQALGQRAGYTHALLRSLTPAQQLGAVSGLIGAKTNLESAGVTNQLNNAIMGRYTLGQKRLDSEGTDQTGNEAYDKRQQDNYYAMIKDLINLKNPAAATASLGTGAFQFPTIPY